MITNITVTNNMTKNLAISFVLLNLSVGFCLYVFN
jgi:hypothetical protein